jgi:hypothetical protein
VEKFYISFSGETLPGCDRDAAKQGLADFFQLDPGVKLDTFFTGEKFVLKRNLDRDTATKIYLALRKLGLLTKMEREASAAAQPQPARKLSPAESLKSLVRKPLRQGKGREPQAGRRADKGPQPSRNPPPSGSTAPAGKSSQQPAQPASKRPQAAAGSGQARPQSPRPASKTPPTAKQPQPATRGSASAGQPPGKTAKQQTAKSGSVLTAGSDLAARARAAEALARDPGRIIKATPSAAPATEEPEREKQRGEPNYFDLRLADGAFNEHLVHEDHFSQPARIGAIIILFAFVLVGLRFWLDTFTAPPSGLGTVIVDADSRPVVIINDQLLRHDRAGNPGEVDDAASIGVSPLTPVELMSGGDLLVHLPPQGQEIPEWLHSVLDIEVIPGRLARCNLWEDNCRPLLNPLGDADFAVDRRAESVLVAEVSEDRLVKLSGDGTVLAVRAVTLEAPVSLSLREDMAYLTQGDTVIALHTADRNFGDERGRYTLAVQGAQATGHVFPRATAWLDNRWWVLMQSRDGSTSGLYRFSDRWEYVDAVPLPDGARPGVPVTWGSKLLAPDHDGETVYRIAADNTMEKTFSDEAISGALAKRREELEFSRSLQVVVLLVMFFAALSLYTFGTIKSLQGKIYKALSDTDEKGFDISNEEILWLDPAPKARAKLRRSFFLLGTAAVLAVAGAIAAGASIGVIVALLLIIAGTSGYCYAIQQSWGSHMGLLEDELVVVDHNNAYRIGKGPKIQYVNNYVIIDDVVVYLGNRFFQQFDPKPLRHRFAPIVRRGIRVDRTTLRLKLINSRHPMFYGGVGFALASVAALLLLILA